MKSRILCALLVLLLSVSVTACAGSNMGPNSSTAGNEISDISIPTSSPIPSPENKAGNTKTDAGNPTSSPLPSPTAESKDGNATGIPATSSDPVLGAYQAALQNNIEFFSVDNKKKLLLDDFLTNKELYGAVFKTTRFAVLDMDGDGTPEVVIELAVDGNPEFFEILHQMNGEVYGYNLVYRALEGLKKDGTFQYSNGATDGGYGKLKFQPDAYETDILGYMKPGQDNGEISFFLNNEPVTKEAYDAFVKKQDGKQDAAWHEFSKESIQTELSAKP